MTTTFEFHITTGDVAHAEQLLAHLKTTQPAPIEFDIVDGTVKVTIAPPATEPRANAGLAAWAAATASQFAHARSSLEPDSPVVDTAPFEPGLWFVDSVTRLCRGCGCTDLTACPGGCSWAEPDLCTACADALSTTADNADLDAAADDRAAAVPRLVSPAEVFDKLLVEAHRRLLLPAARRVTPQQAWAVAWCDFEGFALTRIIHAAVEELLGYPAPGIDDLVHEYLPAFEEAVAGWEGEAADTGELVVTIEADTSALEDALAQVAQTLDRRDAGDQPGGTAELLDVDGEPVAHQTEAPAAEPEPTTAGGSGDAGVREAPKVQQDLATPPGPPASFDPTPGPMVDQVIELLDAYPEVVFTPTEVDVMMRYGDSKSVATALSQASKKGRCEKVARGQYRANQPAAVSEDLRERITAWLTDNASGSAGRIAGDLDAHETAVVNELRRMTEAQLVRLSGNGWVLCTANDTARRHEERRAAATEGL